MGNYLDMTVYSSFCPYYISTLLKMENPIGIVAEFLIGRIFYPVPITFLYVGVGCSNSAQVLRGILIT